MGSVQGDRARWQSCRKRPEAYDFEGAIATEAVSYRSVESRSTTSVPRRRPEGHTMLLPLPTRWTQTISSVRTNWLLAAMVAMVGMNRMPLGAEESAVDRHPELKRLSPTDDIWIDLPNKQVVVGGTICLDKGPIEYFACPKDTKDYESLVAVRSSARLVHTALLAIGLQPGRPVSFDPEYVAATGPVVSVRMRWKHPDGGTRVVPAQDWVRDTRSGAAMTERWVFAGSSFWNDPADGKEYYQADGGDLICLSNFPTALLDLPIPSTQSNEALLFEAFEGRVPPVGTDVELLLSKGE